MSLSIYLYIFIGMFSSLLIIFFGFSIVKMFFDLDKTNYNLAKINIYIISALNFIDFIGLSFISMLQGFQKFVIIRTNQVIKTVTFLGLLRAS